MIIITNQVDIKKHCTPGDTFTLTVWDRFGSECVITEEITVEKVIDYAATFKFADEDGTCSSFNLCGIFSCNGQLPREIREATHFNDLTTEQKLRFSATCGTKVGA